MGAGILGMIAGQAYGDIVGQGIADSNDRRQMKQQTRLQRLQIEGQKEMSEWQYKQQMKMWEETNYKAQVEQMAKAGLNPALMYGMGGGGGATTNAQPGASVQGANAPMGGGEKMGAMGMGIQGAMAAAQIEVMKSQAKLNNVNADKTAGADTANVTQDTENKKTQQKLWKTQNKLQELDLNMNNITFWDRANKIASEAIEQEERGVQAGVQTQISQATIDDNIKRIKQEAVNVGIEKLLMESNMRVNQAQINKMSADIIQRGQELKINEFRAEFEANYPGVGRVGGNVLQQLMDEINKIMKMGTGIKPNTMPMQVPK